MKFGICHEMFQDTDWDQQCRLIAEIGYEGIELAPFMLGPLITDVPVETRQAMRRRAEESGLQVFGMHWLLAKTEGFHLTTADSTVRKRTAQYLIELGRACADFGGNVMVFGSPGQRSLEPGMSRDQAYDNAAEVFRTALPAVADRGVRLCMEPLGPAETDFVNTCADAMELAERVDHPDFGLHQDVKAMRAAESDPIPVLIERYARDLLHFHVNDTNRLGPGMGETDYAPILNALQKIDYDGWVSVEVFDYSPGPENIARRSLQYMQDVSKRIGS